MLVQTRMGTGLVLAALAVLGLGVVSAAAAPAPAPEAKAADLPQGPPPTLVVARVEDGKLVVRRLVTITKAREITDPTGRVTKALFTETHETMEQHNLDGVQATDTAGKKVEAKALEKALGKDTFIALSADGKPVDPAYLKVLKEGTLAVILPQPGFGARPVAPLPPVIKPLPVKP